MKNISIVKLGFSKRTTNALMRANIITLEKLMSLTEYELRNIRNMGEKSIAEVLKFQKSVKNDEDYLDSLMEIEDEMDVQMFITKEWPELKYADSDMVSNRMNQLKNTSIIKLGLSTRTTNALMKANINTLAKVMCMSEYELKRIQNIGTKSVQEVLEFQKSVKSNLIDLDIPMMIEKNINYGKMYTPKNYTVWEIANPEVDLEKVKQILFINDSGTLKEDIKIKELNFSVRTQNCLKNSNYENISDVANEKYGKFVEIRNLGKNSINEVVQYLKEKTYVIFLGEKINEIAQSVIDTIKNSSLESYSYYKDVFYQLKYLFSKNEDYISSIYNQEKSINYLIYNEKFIDLIKNDKTIQMIIDCFVLFMIEENKMDGGVWESDYFQNIGLYELSIKRLVENKKIEKSNNGKYRKWLPCIDDFINSLPNKYKKVVSMRLEGKTLEACGAELNLTRERVRQIVNKALRKKPLLREDEYAYWYQRYKFSEEAFCMIFNEVKITFNYLKAVYKYGEIDIEFMNADDQLTKTIYFSLKNYLNRNSILLGDEFVPCKREKICRKIAEMEYSDKDAPYDLFWDKYMSVLKEKNIDDNEKLLFPSQRAFEARIEDSPYVLSKYGRKFRYFPIDECDVLELVQQIHLEQFKNVEISTLKLFTEYKDVMEEFNIRDEYELHNLLKKTEEKWNLENKYDVKFTRMPLMAFGLIDRDRQVENLLFAVAPVSMEEFCEYYEIEYGVLARTVAANFTKSIYKYYNNGMFTTSQPTFTQEESIYMRNVLVEDFYFIEDVVKVFKNHFHSGDVKEINTKTLGEIGYRVYTNYIVRYKFSSASEYFRKLLLEKDNIDLKKLDKRLVYIQIFNNTVDILRSQYQLIEYEDMKFIRLDRLQSVYSFVTLDFIEKYVDDAIEAANGMEFFTVHYLEKKGFTHLVEKIQLGEWFRAGLIKNSRKLRFIKTGGNIIFSLGDKPITTLDFIKYVLKPKEKMDIYAFIQYIKDTYGVSLSKDKLTYLIKPTSMYYDSIMEKIYYTKDYYYDEI